MRKPPTLHDIARAAGVSFNTVSRALNDRPDINAETRRRVLEVARCLDYRPNQLARSLRRRSTATLGVVVADLANPFFAEVVEGIERVAAARGYSIIVANSEENAAREAEALRTLYERQVDGVLLAPTQQDADALEYLQALEIPYCLLARFFPSLAAPAVINDDREGARLAVTHLISRGHRRILYLHGPLHISSARLRLAGYRLALEEAGLHGDEALLIETDARMQGGLDGLMRALDRKLQFTAVFCFSDYVSFGAYRALRQAGLAIPRDVAVVGYDDIALAQVVTPSLTTVRIAKTRLGEMAAESLLARITGAGGVSEEQSRPNEPIILAPELVVRDSS